VRASLIGREVPRVDLLLDVGVVLRDLQQILVAQNVRATVTDLPDEISRPVDHHRRSRRPHPPLVLLHERALEDLSVGIDDGLLDDFCRLGIGAAGHAFQGLRHDPHRHLARHLAGGVSPHAIGHDEHPMIRDHEVAVFVARAHDTDVGAPRTGESDSVSHVTERPPRS
jgi:hypothetical protein